MVLSEDEKFTFVYKSLNKANKTSNDISLSLIDKLFNKIVEDDIQVTIIDVFVAVKDLFDYYNAFVEEKKISAPLIGEETYRNFYDACEIFEKTRENS